jgi:hypothetical protein
MVLWSEFLLIATRHLFGWESMPNGAHDHFNGLPTK